MFVEQLLEGFDVGMQTMKLQSVKAVGSDAEQYLGILMEGVIMNCSVPVDIVHGITLEPGTSGADGCAHHSSPSTSRSVRTQDVQCL
jgi:hypothetical protein